MTGWEAWISSAFLRRRFGSRCTGRCCSLLSRFRNRDANGGPGGKRARQRHLVQHHCRSFQDKQLRHKRLRHQATPANHRPSIFKRRLNDEPTRLENVAQSGCTVGTAPVGWEPSHCAMQPQRVGRAAFHLHLLHSTAWHVGEMRSSGFLACQGCLLLRSRSQGKNGREHASSFFPHFAILVHLKITLYRRSKRIFYRLRRSAEPARSRSSEVPFPRQSTIRWDCATSRAFQMKRAKPTGRVPTE